MTEPISFSEPCNGNKPVALQKLQVSISEPHMDMLKEIAHLSGTNVSATANIAIRDWLIANYETLHKLYSGYA